MSFENNILVKKIQSLYFKVSMFLRGVFQSPAQTKKDIQIFKAVFDHFLYQNKKITVFEWGCGFSTLYYANYLRKKGADFHWHAIDNNSMWQGKVKETLKKKNLHEHVHVYLKEFLPFWEKPGWKWENIPPPCGVFSPKSENEKAYVNFPNSLDEKFDIVIIDARFRRHCLAVAKDALASNGIVIIHDAQKEHYQVGLDGFQHRAFFTTGAWVPFKKLKNKVWVGSKGNSQIFDSLKNF